MKKKWIKIGLPAVVIFLGVAGMSVIKATAPEKEKQEAVDTRPTLKVKALQAQQHTVTINGYGEVKPFERTQLAAQVSGEVVSWNPEFVAGGLVKRGEVLFSIEKDSYEAALYQAEATLSQAKAALIEEQAKAKVAKREASKLPDSAVTALYLRQPQLLSAEASVKSAQAQLKIAQRNLDNCEVRAPYDALIVSRNLGQGQFVQQGAQVGELYNVERADIVFPVAGFDGEFLPVDLRGTEARITTKGLQPIERQGFISRDLGVVDEATRMSQLVVSIENPYSIDSDKPALKFGHYVEVTFKGKTLNNVYKLPQTLVSQRKVWLVDEQQQLQSKSVEVIREEGSFFYISAGLNEQDRVVMTLPEYPQKGMKIKVANGEKSVAANPKVNTKVASTGGAQ